MEKRRREREQAQKAPVRPFEGLAYECDLVALREFVPSATATLPVRPEVSADRDITLATVVPGAVAALVREENTGDGAEAATAESALVGMQVQAYSDDLGADLAASVLWAAGASVGETLAVANPSDSTPPVTEVLQADAPLEITVHKDFQWWLAGGAETNPQITSAVEQANQLMMPTERIEGVDAAWWVDAGDRAHLRWVRPEDEDVLMAALARVHADGGLTLGEGSRFAGTFRAHGLLVPVFDLDLEKHPLEWRDATLALGTRLEEALADDGPLTGEQRRSRDGLRSRQVTIR